MSGEGWSEAFDAEGLPRLAARIAASLSAASPPFCLWLIGDLGAGKTTLTGHIFRALGLDARMPVTSPTYTYVNEYKVGDHWYAHLDLYRAGAAFSLEDLGLVDARRYAGFFVEWPGAVPPSPAITPTHELHLMFGEQVDDTRRAVFSKK